MKIVLVPNDHELKINIFLAGGIFITDCESAAFPIL
jgi:hypothetical protein